jgi:uncharacterized protein YbjQ (UPF0145 family)
MVSCASLKNLLPGGNSSNDTETANSPTSPPSPPSNNETGIPTLLQITIPDVKNTFRVGWSWYTRIPNKDYTVVGIIVLRNVELPAVELMNEAQNMKADDIMNVRVDVEKKNGRETILAASAVAIKYTATDYEGPSEVGEKLFDTGAVSWSRYPTIPNKDFTIVGIVTVNTSKSGTPSADLMEKARELGAHDIINVIVDVKNNEIVGAAATAIKYTNTTYTPKLSF